jgi:hypothetical protein
MRAFASGVLPSVPLSLDLENFRYTIPFMENDGLGFPKNDSSLNSTSRTRHYADILNSLFWDDAFNRIDLMFELVCTLVRANGMRDTGWDSYYESLAFLEDLKNLQLIDLPIERFPKPDRTIARLALISYCHVTEMNFPYELLANLLRLRTGKKYSTEPLGHLAKPILGKKKVLKGIKPASPEKKIKEVEKLSVEAGLADVGKVLRQIYDPVIRNAFYHSDYVLHDDGMRLLAGLRFWKEQRGNKSLITFADLGEVTREAFAFHSALIMLYKRACRSFNNFRNKLLPFDSHYKGLLEFTFDGDLLTGFRAFWPNGSISSFEREADGRSHARNLTFRADGSIDFMVGYLASCPGTFSPCVEVDGVPIYATVPGTDKKPYWPDELKAFSL